MADKSASKPKNSNEKKNNTTSFILTVAIIAFIGYFVISCVSLQLERSEKAAEVAQAQQVLQEKTEENEELENVLSESDHSAYIEKIARDVLGYVLPGERVYYNISTGE